MQSVRSIWKRGRLALVGTFVRVTPPPTDKILSPHITTTVARWKT